MLDPTTNIKKSDKPFVDINCKCAYFQKYYFIHDYLISLICELITVQLSFPLLVFLPTFPMFLSGSPPYGVVKPWIKISTTAPLSP
jgi:hypothetical protein